MKKLFLLLTLGAFTFTANSQTQQTRDSGAISIGVVAGVNFASINGDDTDNLSSLTGIHAGVVVDIPLGEMFSIQPGLVYSAQGAEYSESEGYDGKFKLDYLNLPVIFKYEVADGFTLEAGPQVGFLMSAKDEYESPGDSGEDEIDEFIKGIDFAASLGLGYRMESGLSIGARYNIGLSEFPDDEEFDVNWKNGVFQVSLGYFF
jgi:hypothetical protein